MNKYKNVLMILLLILSLINCDGKAGPTEPKQPSYAEIYDGIYERVYPIVNDWDTRLPGIAIWPTEQGGLSLETTEIGENKFKFESGKRLKPNYPNGIPYKICVSDMKVWTEERKSVANKLSLNGTFLTPIASGDEEIAQFRIDVNNRVYSVSN